MTKTPPKFTPTGRGNYLLEMNAKRDWTVSYNPNTAQDPFGASITSILNLLGGDAYDGEETALEVESKWYILTGDYRKPILEAYKETGILGVIKIFKKHLADNPWSTGTKADLTRLIKNS